MASLTCNYMQHPTDIPLKFYTVHNEQQQHQPQSRFSCVHMPAGRLTLEHRDLVSSGFIPQPQTTSKTTYRRMELMKTIVLCVFKSLNADSAASCWQAIKCSCTGAGEHDVQTECIPGQRTQAQHAFNIRLYTWTLVTALSSKPVKNKHSLMW